MKYTGKKLRLNTYGNGMNNSKYKHKNDVL